MDTNHRASRRVGLARVTAAAGLVMSLVAGQGQALGAHIDDPMVLTLVPKHVFFARGFSFRNGDYFALEPAFLFVGDAKPGSRPIVGVVRPMVGVGGSGLGVGFAFQPFFEPIGAQVIEDYVSSLPISLEVHIERMYGPTDWRSATYLGPQLSLSVYVLKASVGVMTNLGDQRDRRGQLGIGGGF